MRARALWALLVALLLVLAFAVFGGYWGIPALIGEATSAMLAPSIINILTSLVLYSSSRRDLAKGLVISTASFNLLLGAYQVYASSILIGSGLFLFTILTAIPSLAVSIFAAIIVLIAYTNEEIIHLNPN